MVLKNTYENNYRIMTLKLTGPEVAVLQHAIRREIGRINEYIQENQNYSYRDTDIANMKMLMSLIADLHDHTIKP